MGGVAVLPPQDYLNDNRDNLFLSPVKPRRNPNLTRSDGRKRSPPTGVRKHRSTAPMVTDPPSTAAGKPLVMGQVKILKRGEPLDELSTVFKGDVTTATVTSRPEKDMNNRKATTMTSRKVTPAKKKAEKEKRSFANPRIEGLKIDDFALSSTNRLGPDPEMVPKQMNKNMADFFFAGSAFVDSPPPSSLPLPGFFNKSFAFAKEEDPSTDLRRMLGLSPF